MLFAGRVREFIPMPTQPGQEIKTSVGLGDPHNLARLYKIVFEDVNEEELEETKLHVSLCAYSPSPAGLTLLTRRAWQLAVYLTLWG